MADYIEREALDKALTLSAANDKDKNRRIWAKAICVLHDIPAADVTPAAHGRWIEWDEFFGRKTGKKNLGVFCSMCRNHADNNFDYCPNCGAKMDGGAGDEA